MPRALIPCPSAAAYNRGCRCEGCIGAKRVRWRSEYYAHPDRVGRAKANADRRRERQANQTTRVGCWWCRLKGRRHDRR